MKKLLPITIGLILLTVGLLVPAAGDKLSITLQPSPTPSPTPLKKKEGCTMPRIQKKVQVQPPPSKKPSQEPQELTAENVRDTAKWLDDDCDGISNWDDNCTYVHNPRQRDRNRNGIGDACEKRNMPGPTPSLTPKKKEGCTMPRQQNNVPEQRSEEPMEERELSPADVSHMLKSLDDDCDGISNLDDNCTYVYNPGQQDRNKNGIGDACDKRRRPYRKSRSKKGSH